MQMIDTFGPPNLDRAFLEIRSILRTGLPGSAELAETMIGEIEMMVFHLEESMTEELVLQCLTNLVNVGVIRSQRDQPQPSNVVTLRPKTGA